MATNLEGQSSDGPTTGLPPLERREWPRVTLATIGDAVVTADADGGVTSLNSAPPSLAGLLVLLIMNGRG